VVRWMIDALVDAALREGRSRAVDPSGPTLRDRAHRLPERSRV